MADRITLAHSWHRNNWFEVELSQTYRALLCSTQSHQNRITISYGSFRNNRLKVEVNVVCMLKKTFKKVTLFATHRHWHISCLLCSCSCAWSLCLSLKVGNHHGKSLRHRVTRPNILYALLTPQYGKLFLAKSKRLPASSRLPSASCQQLWPVTSIMPHTVAQPPMCCCSFARISIRWCAWAPRRT